MFVTLSIEEINRFPAEVRDFLCDYVTKSLPLNSETSAFTSDGTPVRMLQVPESDTMYNLRTNHSECDTTPTRYGRTLVAGNFGWEEMMRTEMPQMWHESYNLICIKVNGESFELELDNAYDIETDKPSTWGFIIILCALFGFGGCVPGIKPARNPKELAKNLEKLGISGGEPVEPRSIGPLLKSITKFFNVWHGKFEEGPPVLDLHWFDFDKRGNFYFAGSTFDDCFEAVKNISLEYFVLEAETNE